MFGINKNSQSKVLCILGPTASGKSGLAERIAEHIDAEIINVDSAQIYKQLNIGSAKPDAKTLAKIPHHLIDIREPFAGYSAADFVQDSQLAIESILQKNKLPILVGGTMLYFKALFEGLADLPEADPETREKLKHELETKGLLALHAELAKHDPVAAKKIKATDPQRILRALEVYRVSGRPISFWHQQQQEKKNLFEPKFDFIKIALIPSDRSILHQRIESRLEQMMQAGFLKEVESLTLEEHFTRDCSALRSVGYRQLLAHILDSEPLDDSFMKAVYATRQLAKRQLTWLRKMPQLEKIDPLHADFWQDTCSLLKTHNIFINH